ncbi:hypothetical protein ACHAPG_002534 [Botrytis cinerea]
MDNNHGTNRPGTENHDILTGHVLKPSKFLSALRVLQLLLALAILGLAGFVVTFIGYSGAILDLFVASATILIIFYILVSTHRFTVIYNYWAIACLDIFLVIFWLAAWITSAVQVRRYRGRFNYYGCGYYFCRRDLLELEERDDLSDALEKRASTSYSTFRGVYIAAAVLAAIEFVLFIVTFAVTMGKILSHHDEGHHSNAFPSKKHTAMEMQTPGQTGHVGQTGPMQTGAAGPNPANPVANQGMNEPGYSGNAAQRI